MSRGCNNAEDFTGFEGEDRPQAKECGLPVQLNNTKKEILFTVSRKSLSAADTLILVQ